MKSFRKSVQSYLGLSEEKSMRRCHAQPRAESSPSELDAPPKPLNLNNCRANRAALGRNNPAGITLCNGLINAGDDIGPKLCDTSGGVKVAENFGELHFAERPSASSSSLAAADPRLAERPSSGAPGGSFSGPGSGFESQELVNSHRRKLNLDDDRDEHASSVRKPDSRSFDSLLGIQDVAGGGGLWRGSTGSLSSQNSSGFCAQKNMNSPRYADTLQLNCTEGLGFESSDEREDSVSLGSDHSAASSPRLHVRAGGSHDWEKFGLMFDGDLGRKHLGNDGSALLLSGSQPILNGDHFVDRECSSSSTGFRRHGMNAAPGGPPKRSSRRTNSFPPPLSSIGRNGQPWVFLRSYRKDGRFVLQEVKAPPHEILRAWREDGRLKLQLVHREEGRLSLRQCDPATPCSDAANDDSIDGGDDDDEGTGSVESEIRIADVDGVGIKGSEQSADISR